MSTPQGPVRSIGHSRRVDRGDATVSVAWERTDAKCPPLTLSDPFKEADTRAANDLCRRVLGPTDSAALFVLGLRPPPSLIQLLLETADQGRRVYVLAPPGFGQGQNDPGLGDRPRAKVLVRRSALPPISVVLSCSEPQAALYFGANEPNARRWVLALDEDQSRGLFATSLHWFWHHAADEGWTEPGGRTLEFRSPQERPFDAAPPQGGSVRLLRRPADHVPMPANAVCVSTGAMPVPHTASRVLVVPSGSGLEPLAVLGSRGAEVLGLPEPLPDLWAVDSSGSVAWNCGEFQLRVALNAAQARAVSTAILAARSTVRLVLNASLRGLAGRVWLPGANAEESLVDEVELPCGDIACGTVEEVTSREPQSWPTAPLLARSVVYSWKCHPPLAPAGAAASKLYQRWKDAQEAFQSRVEALADRLATAKHHSDEAKSRLTKWMGTALGFDRRWQELTTACEKLRACDLNSMALTTARETLAELERVEAHIAEHLKGLSVDIAEAEEREQRAAWEQEREHHERLLVELDRQIDQNKQRQQELESELKVGKRQAESDADWSARQRKLKDDVEACKRAGARWGGERSSHKQFVERGFVPQRKVGPLPVDRPKKGFVPTPGPAKVQLPDEVLPRVGQLLERGSDRCLVITRWEDLPVANAEATRLKARVVTVKE